MILFKQIIYLLIKTIMKKAILGLLSLFSMAAVFFYCTQDNDAAELTQLQKDNIEALSGIDDYWNLLDYNCVNVRCVTLFGNYPSTVAEFVVEGQGTVPHIWNCPGCDGNGWIVG